MRAHWLFVFICSTAFAQGEIQVPDITVTGSADKSALDIVPTVSEISGTRLQRKKQSTVGETLANETGVASTQFGPNASRPVIRGMADDRIRVLQNGTGVLDASAASQDHAVAVDPLNIERVEIVRGPGALLYGSSAIGGVVNMVTNRVPSRMPDKFTGKFESRLSSTDMGRSGGVALDTGLGSRWALHADGSMRAAEDYHVPGYARTGLVRASDPAPGDEGRGRVYNSGNRTGDAAGGASYFFNRGYLGAGFSNYESTYGNVVERFVHINMIQQRFDLHGEIRDLGMIQSLRLKNTYSRYKHDEIDEGSLATTFKNDGNETRLEARHAPLLGFSGILGAQVNFFDFSAKGDESFLPGTKNQNGAAFLFEEREMGAFKPSFGVRAEKAEVESKTDATFGAGASKSFTNLSGSMGLMYQMLERHALALNLAYTERAPNYQELFANGPHIATGIFEVGDRDLNKERGQSAELSWRYKGERLQGRTGVFVQDIRDFIALVPTGATDPGSNLEIYNYQSVDARMYGAEIEYRLQLPALLQTGALEIEFKADSVQGVSRSGGGNLPRMTPIRESLGLIYKNDLLQADATVQRSEKQTKTAAFETETRAFTQVNLGVETPVRTDFARFSVFARVHNVFDVKARNHVSVIKDIAPLPGRNFIVGVQASF